MSNRSALIHISLEEVTEDVTVAGSDSPLQPPMVSGSDSDQNNESPFTIFAQNAKTLIDEDFGSCILLSKDNHFGIKKNTNVRDSSEKEKTLTNLLQDLNNADWTLTIWIKWVDHEVNRKLEFPWLENTDKLCKALSKKQGIWQHLALRHEKSDGLKVGFFIDEVQQVASDFPTLKKDLKDLEEVVKPIGNASLCLAYFNLFPKALSPAELSEEIALDRASSFPFLDVSPLSFRLDEPETYRSLLYLTKSRNGSRKFEWEVENLTHLPLSLEKIPEDDNDKCYHFKLEFRPNTFTMDGENPDLKLSRVPESTESQDWKWAVKTEMDGPQKLQILQLKYAGTSQLIIKNEEKLRFQVDYKSAKGHSRGTRVNLKYDHLYQGNRSHRKVIGNALQRVNIIDEVPKKNDVISVFIAGSNTLVNDGTTTNELRIRMKNISDRDLKFDENTKLTLTFPQLSAWNALAEKSKLAVIILKVVKKDGIPNDESFSVNKINDSTNIRFEVNLKDSKLLENQPFKASDCIDLVLSNVKTGKPAGRGQVYFNYSGFPELPGKKTVLEVWKSPVSLKKTQVGIGKLPDKGLRLDVAGKTRLEELEIKGKENGKIELKISDSKGRIDIDQTSISEGKNTDPTLEFSKSGKWGRIGGVFGVGIWGNGQVRDDNEPGLFIDQKNNVNVEGDLELKKVALKISEGKNTDPTLEFSKLKKWGRIGGVFGVGIWGNGQVRNDNEPGLFISPKNNITIGGKETKGKLTVMGKGPSEQSLSYFFIRYRDPEKNSFSGHWKGNYSYSIYATNFCAASEWHAFSDQRTKIIDNQSDAKLDLHTLTQLEVIDYTMRDPTRGGKNKKLIGQQVRAVYPQAVNLIKDVVPDIMQYSNIAEGRITLKNTLKVGEIVRLIFPKEESLCEVLEADPDGFRVNRENDPEVFIYGREVDDFHVVDYEAIAMLNVSASQEQQRQIEALQKSNEELSKRIMTLEATMGRK